MFAAARSNILMDWKTTKEQSIRCIVIHAKRPNAIVYSKLTLTLNCTRKATKTNREILAQGAKLSTSNRVVLMVLKMRIQVAGSIWADDTVGEEFVLTFGVARWSISTAFTDVAAKLGLQVLPAEAQPLAPELYWDLYAPKGLNSARNFFTGLNFESQGTAHALELASCVLDVPRLSIPDRMQDHSAHDRINPVKVGCITRLVPQKGLHLIRHAIYRMLELGGQLVLLGSSPMPHIQGEFEELVNHLKDHPNVRLILKYDEVLSNSINAASDIFIMCSLFEPYCLAQMTAMRFGSVPVVRKTGGLNDSVFDVDEDTVLLQFCNGFTFLSPDEQGINCALDRAFNLYLKNNESWQQLVKRNMKIDFTWDASAAQYVELYEMSVAWSKSSNSALTSFKNVELFCSYAISKRPKVDYGVASGLQFPLCTLLHLIKM